MSLKMRLGIGAAILGAGTILTALILVIGMEAVGNRLDAALAADGRMARYASLSRQAATFLVVATEAVQRDQPPETRIARVTPVADQIRGTFERLHKDLATAIDSIGEAGIDAKSRFGTESLGLARMEALLGSTLSGLAADTTDVPRLRAHIDTFASSFDPLLNQAVNTEIVRRNENLAGIEALRRSLTSIALVIAGLSVALVLAFYVLLIRPQFQRLDRLRQAASRIGQEDFAVALPVAQQDEIGKLYAETNRMAAALSTRKEQVQEEWGRLNATIAEKTDALRKANAELEKVDGNRRRFFADVSHELRTPLTVILMEAQLGQQGSGDPLAAFATIEARAGRLNRRIDDLLRVARSDSGQLALEPVSLPLTRLAADVQTEIRAEIEAAGMVLEILEMPNDVLCCDPNWIRQVIVSLARNAIRHARDGGALEIAPIASDGRAGLAITDNGQGIPEDLQEDVFLRFSQGNEASQGFGIGLALAHWVVEEHGGQIEITSPVPREEALGVEPGTRVSVWLPTVAVVPGQVTHSNAAMI